MKYPFLHERKPEILADTVVCLISSILTQIKFIAQTLLVGKNVYHAIFLLNARKKGGNVKRVKN